MKAKSRAGVVLIALVVATLCLSGTLLPGLARARGLTGTYRADAIATMSKTCLGSAADDPDLSKIPKAALQSYCRCFATHIADRATRADIDADRSPATVAIEVEAVSACYDGLPDAARR